MIGDAPAGPQPAGDRPEPVSWPAPEPAPGSEPAPVPGAPPVGQPGATGHPAVDAVLHAVARAAGAEPADQLPAYRAVHRTLRETLASIDED